MSCDKCALCYCRKRFCLLIILGTCTVAGPAYIASERNVQSGSVIYTYWQLHTSWQCKTIANKSVTTVVCVLTIAECAKWQCDLQVLLSPLSASRLKFFLHTPRAFSMPMQTRGPSLASFSFPASIVPGLKGVTYSR